MQSYNAIYIFECEIVKAVLMGSHGVVDYYYSLKVDYMVIFLGAGRLNPDYHQFEEGRGVRILQMCQRFSN